MRSPAVSTETTWAPDGKAMLLAKAAPLAAGEPEAEGLDMRRPISTAITTKPATISRPITITSTFNKSGAAACGKSGAGEGDAKTTP